jgi:hypothetical protein
MRKVGFSTGALAKSDFKKAVSLSNKHHTNAVEYSALRLDELEPLLAYLRVVGIGNYEYVSFHAPSYFEAKDENTIVLLLLDAVQVWNVNIVVHPDAIYDFSLWRQLGSRLCVENMDHRKTTGRTADELEDIFEELPQACLCFDIGHAHQIDRSLSDAYQILRRYRNRIMHVHASEVSDDGAHRAFSTASAWAFAKLADLIPATAAIILETVTPDEMIGNQLAQAKAIFPSRDESTPAKKKRPKKK